jgi:hypothetical protein
MHPLAKHVRCEHLCRLLLRNRGFLFADARGSSDGRPAGRAISAPTSDY